MKNKDEDKHLSQYVIITGIAIYFLWRFFSIPDALGELAEFVSGVAVCFGIFVVIATLMWLMRKVVSSFFATQAAGRCTCLLSSVLRDNIAVNCY